MIIDNVKNAEKYFKLSPAVAKALKYMQENDLTGREPGRYEIDGADIYVMVQKYGTKPAAEGKWEAHRKYIDIQYVADGAERMGYANIGNMSVIKDYAEEGDFLLLQGSGSMISCPKGTFALFDPDDAHMPGIASGASEAVVKLVFKVRVGA